MMRFPIIAIACCAWGSSARGQDASNTEVNEWINRHAPAHRGGGFIGEMDGLYPLSESVLNGWLWMIAMVCIVMWLWWLWRGRVKLILDWLKGARASEWTRTKWQEWTVESGASSQVALDLDVPHADWLLLSPTEREVIQLLANGFSVHLIAEKFNCSKAHIYNMRSSIRKKWGMDASEDFMARIQEINSRN